MACETGGGCQREASFLVELLSSTESAASRRACAVHLAAAVTWAHEVAQLRSAVDSDPAPAAVTMSPIPDVDQRADDPAPHVDRPPYDDEQQQLLELELVAQATPPGRDEPGLIAWTQRAHHRPGYFPPTRGSALAGLIAWPLAVTALVILAVVTTPPLVTAAAIRHAIDDRWYPTAREDLVIRSLTSVLVLIVIWLAYMTVRSYWDTRPVRAPRPRHRRTGQLT